MKNQFLLYVNLLLAHHGFRLNQYVYLLMRKFFFFKIMDEEAERECENARHFTCTLCALLPSLLAIRSTIEVDQAILEFSSKYCEGMAYLVF